MRASPDADAVSRAERSRRRGTPYGAAHVLWLALARVVWLLFAALTLVPFMLSLPDTWRGLEAMANDSHSGIPPAVYAWVALRLICLAMLVAMVIASILFLRRSDNIMALLAGALSCWCSTAASIRCSSSCHWARPRMGPRPSPRLR